MALILKGRAKLKGSTVIGKRPYAIDGVFNPELVLDFQKDFYRTNSVAKTFSNAITHTRASTATYVDSTGTLQTAAVNEPRLGHHVYNGTAYVNEGLLHESEARTNLALGNNTPSDTTYWRAAGTSNGITHTVLGTGVENGAAYIDVQYAGTATSTFNSLLYNSTTTRTAASTGQTYVAALTGRVIDGTNPAGGGVSAGINQETAPSTFVSTVSSNATGSFSRIDGNTDKTVFARSTVSGSANQVYCFVAFTFTSGETIDVTYRLKLFQFELGQMPSSFIPTAGSTVTRSADVLTIPAANLPYPEPVVIGPELVTNGTFDTDSDWTHNSSWAISGGLATHSATAFSAISQPYSFAIGSVYEITYTLSDYSAGNFFAAISSASGLVSDQIKAPTVTSNGTYSFVFVANSTSNHFGVVAGATAVGSIDNISVREINPLALSIQMDGRVTYADTNSFPEAVFFNWQNGNNRIDAFLSTNLGTGQYRTRQFFGGVIDQATQANTSSFSPDILVPFNTASRHGSTFINGAVDGVALTADLTPVALPDLSAANLQLGFAYNGTIRTFRMWGQDIGDTGLVEATEPSLVPSLSLTFDGTENSFIVNDWTS